MLCEVDLERRYEILFPDVNHKLAKDRSTFRVRDAVEVGAHRFHVGHVSGHWVSGGELVLAVGPVLALGVEGCP